MTKIRQVAELSNEELSARIQDMTSVAQKLGKTSCEASSMVEHVATPATDGSSILAASLQFCEVDKNIARRLVTEHHYLHRGCSISFSWGIKTSRSIQGILTIGKLASWSAACSLVGETKNDLKNPLARTHDVFELNRLWLHDDLPKNGESRFIGWCLRQFRKQKPNGILLSYADTGTENKHFGGVYQATNWIYTGPSAQFADISVEGFEDYRSVPQYIRGGFIYKCSEHGEFALPYSENVTPEKTTPCPHCSNLVRKTNKREWSSKSVVVDREGVEHKICRKARTLKHRYVWFANREDMPLLNWPILPYPKREIAA